MKVHELLHAAFAAAPAQQIIDAERTLSYAELDERIRACAAALAGLAPGERVAVIAANSIGCVVALAAGWTAGLVVVPLNPAFTVPELAYIMEHAAPRAVIADAAKLADVRAAAPAGTVACWLAIEDLWALPAAPRRAVEAPDVIALLYTSGTTGRPKGVMLDHANLTFMQAAWREVNAITADDVILCALPLHHSYPFVLLFLAGLAARARMVIERGFQIPRLVELIARHRITMLPAVPTAYQMLTTVRWERERYDLSSLRILITGGAPLAAATRHAVEAMFPTVPLYDGYGITETSPLISLGPFGSEPRLNASGRVIPGVRVEVRDEAGRPLPVGEAGELWIGGPGVMRGYYRDPSATAAAIVDGWYRSGDVGRFDANGYLYICDRVKDLIIVGGENVYPREVEAALLEHPSVVQAAVTRMDAPDTGEAPLAYVVPAPGATLQIRELLAHLRTRLAPFKLPRKFEIVDAIPISAAGKILRRLLPR